MLGCHLSLIVYFSDRQTQQSAYRQLVHPNQKVLSFPNILYFPSSPVNKSPTINISLSKSKFSKLNSLNGISLSPILVLILELKNSSLKQGNRKNTTSLLRNLKFFVCYCILLCPVFIWVKYGNIELLHISWVFVCVGYSRFYFLTYYWCPDNCPPPRTIAPWAIVSRIIAPRLSALEGNNTLEKFSPGQLPPKKIVPWMIASRLLLTDNYPKDNCPKQYTSGNCPRGKFPFWWFVAYIIDPQTNGLEENCPAGKLPQG